MRKMDLKKLPSETSDGQESMRDTITYSKSKTKSFLNRQSLEIVSKALVMSK